MKQDKRRGLTRIALALALAGYCVAPVALAEDSAWVDSGETNIFQGTIPWLYSEGGSATTDADRVTLTSDLKGARPQGSETDKRLYSVKRRTKNAKTFHDKCEKFNFRASNETAALTAVFLFIKWDHFG
ncbi:outer membrane protein [Escherichia coli]|nr:outer membrane protein [Escherichia coli]